MPFAAIAALIVTALLLAAVAAFLVVVVVLLVRIARVLDDIVGAVGAIADRTEPIDQLLAPVEAHLRSAAAGIDAMAEQTSAALPK